MGNETSINDESLSPPSTSCFLKLLIVNNNIIASLVSNLVQVKTTQAIEERQKRRRILEQKATEFSAGKKKRRQFRMMCSTSSPIHYLRRCSSRLVSSTVRRRQQQQGISTVSFVPSIATTTSPMPQYHSSYPTSSTSSVISPTKSVVSIPTRSDFGVRQFHFTSTNQRNYDIKSYDGVSAEISEVIYEHARQPQTSVSLQALMRTGRGEFLHKTFDDISSEDIQNNGVDDHTATELVLIQVSFASWSFLIV